MTFILETERLVLREFVPGDAAFILELLNTEAWLRYIGDRQVYDLTAAEQYLLKGPVASYAANGFGLWMVTLKDTGIPLGMCGIIKREVLPYPDLGFAFLPQYTGSGYATESVLATLRYATLTLTLPKLLAITLPENQSSIKLLEKAGFIFEEKQVWAATGETLLHFSYAKNL